jgi:hypothetical protein
VYYDIPITATTCNKKNLTRKIKNHIPSPPDKKKEEIISFCGQEEC